MQWMYCDDLSDVSIFLGKGDNLCLQNVPFSERSFDISGKDDKNN